ncbi:hypothetical protein DPMN_112426 [Dreissena polymorpha]|uniref:Uncharacterized protein n=1 Tax=Dreissena polymorpha TaxID=45954 RepID=A0A9D4KGT2_DREPO|nr:hypothetical protein DPMN_112426 [Dreissena polymorpha]
MINPQDIREVTIVYKLALIMRVNSIVWRPKLTYVENVRCVKLAVTSTIDIRHSNIESALTSTFGTSPEYRAGANVEPALTSAFDTIPEYRAGANVKPAVTSTFRTSMSELARHSPQIDIRD